MIFRYILIGISSLMFLPVGFDKFLNFIEPPCTLMTEIPVVVWKFIGVLQIAAAVLLWFPTLSKYVAGFFLVFMLVITAVHLSQGTTDIAGSVFMAFLMALLVWNPSFLRRTK